MLQAIVKKYGNRDATRLAGEVFGKLLDRDADAEGYKYVLECFRNGVKSIPQIVVEFVASDEFFDRFARGRSPSEIANYVTRLLVGRSVRETDREAAEKLLIRSGLREFARRIVTSEEYLYNVGADRVPPYGHNFADERGWFPDLAIEGAQTLE